MGQKKNIAKLAEDRFVAGSYQRPGGVVHLRPFDFDRWAFGFKPFGLAGVERAMGGRQA
jgi:hypothetical protein